MHVRAARRSCQAACAADSLMLCFHYTGRGLTAGSAAQSCTEAAKACQHCLQWPLVPPARIVLSAMHKSAEADPGWRCSDAHCKLLWSLVHKRAAKICLLCLCCKMHAGCCCSCLIQLMIAGCSASTGRPVLIGCLTCSKHLSKKTAAGQVSFSSEISFWAARAGRISCRKPEQAAPGRARAVTRLALSRQLKAIPPSAHPAALLDSCSLLAGAHAHSLNV